MRLTPTERLITEWALGLLAIALLLVVMHRAAVDTPAREATTEVRR